MGDMMQKDRLDSSTGRSASRSHEKPVVDKKVWLVNVVSWFVTVGCVIYHYRFQSPKYQNVPLHWKDAIWMLPLFGGAIWIVSKTNRPMSLSLSDATKLLCCMIIFLCTMYHYYHVF